MQLINKKILLIVTAGIAAYKSVLVLRLLQNQGALVQVMMTAKAQEFVGSITFQALSGFPVIIEESNASHAWGIALRNDNMAHISLSRLADLILIAPCTANSIAKFASGIADDLLSCLVLARAKCPLLIAPAMNQAMWHHPATQRNIQLIQQDGAIILPPESGSQACGENGVGRMLEENNIVSAVIAQLSAKILANKRILITAGATYEAIDPVRGISNISTGKMGFAIAQAAANAGAKVELVAGISNLPTPYGVLRHDVKSAEQMLAACLASASACDIFIAVAAVADYRVKNISLQKIKKRQSSTNIAANNQQNSASVSHPVEQTLELIANPDILASIAQLANPPYCVGFAAESENLAEYATSKLIKKNIPLVVGNLVQESMGKDRARVSLFDRNGEHPLPEADKEQLAALLISEIAKRIV